MCNLGKPDEGYKLAAAGDQDTFDICLLIASLLFDH